MELLAAVFFCLAGVDYVLGDRFCLASAMKEGLKALTELLLIMTGFMALAPWIAVHAAPAVSPLFTALGCDPSLFSGILLSCDAGGAVLAREIALDPQAGLYNGLIVASFYGAAFTGAVPLALGNTRGAGHEAAVGGISAAFLFLPFACLLTGAICGFPLGMMLRNTWPVLVLSLLVLLALVFIPQRVAALFTLLGTAVRAVAIFGFCISVLQEATGRVFLPGLAPLDEIFPVICRIGVFLGGILPFFTVAQQVLEKPLLRLSRRLGILPEDISYLFLTTANGIPTLLHLDTLAPLGVTLNVAYVLTTAYTVGDFLAFSLQFAPRLAVPMMAGRLLSGFLLLALCLWWQRGRKTPSVV